MQIGQLLNLNLFKKYVFLEVEWQVNLYSHYCHAEPKYWDT